MTHIMTDLETYGLEPGCPVLSIGAVVMGGISGVASNPQRMLKKHTFYGVAKLDQSAYGLKPNQATVDFWSKQSEEARKVLTDPTASPLPVMLKQFARWLPADARVWGNGADFDNPILSAAYRACGLPQPWQPYNGRCYRTIKNLAPSIKLVRQGTHHNALNDAMSQAEHMERIVAALGLSLG